MRAVVDTNVLVSGLMHPGRTAALVLDAIARRQLVPVVSADVMAEYQRVLPRPRLRLAAADVHMALNLLAGLADWVLVPPYTGRPPLPDRSDWPFIGCALATGCPVITGNLKHFPAEVGVRVMTVRAWVDVGRDGGA